MLTEQLAMLKAKGKGNCPEAIEVTEKIKGALSKLKIQLQGGAIHGVINVFKDIGHGQALKQLEKAAHASKDLANRESDYEEKAGAFEYHTSKMIETAEQTAIHGKHATSQLVDNIHAAAKDLAELTPQISHAGKLLLMNPNNELFNAHFTDLCDDWRKNSDELIALVDAATDTLDYMTASEEAIKEEIAAAVSGVEAQNPAVIVARGGNAARMSLRVEQVANAEAENSETTEFRENILTATQDLKESNSHFLSNTKNVAVNPRFQPVQIEFKKSGDKLIGRVVDVRKALYPPPPTPPPSPPPPPPPPP
jgi:vinculin